MCEDLYLAAYLCVGNLPVMSIACPGLLVMISALPGNSSAKLLNVIGGRSMYLGLSTII